METGSQIHPSDTETISQVRNTLGLLPVIALSAALTGPVYAQAQETSPGAGNDVTLGQINVEASGGGSANAVEQDTNVGRIPGKVKDVPQVVNVITPEVMEQQQTQTLEQVLRNVPGVTMAIGEGGGGLNGDQFKIRGFEAKGDIYSDGLRDFGVYVRDSFAYEGVQVFKGPSSENFGMGTTGGAINTQLKRAHLDDETIIEGQAGNGPLGRVMLDVNKQLSETSALRFVAMGHWQDLVDRDNNESNRAGVLATGSFGIGTDLTWDVSYFYQHGDRTPDYGVPMVARGASSPDNPLLPITEFGVPRSSFYGKAQDHDIFNTHAVTSKVKWEAEDWLTLYNDTRLSVYDRDFSTSVPSCNDNNGSTCASDFFAGNPAFLSGYGGGNPTYEQNSWGIQNVTTGVAKFETGSMRHEMVVGLDMFYQKNERDAFSVTGKDPSIVDVRNPGATFDLPYSVARNPNGDRNGSGTNIGLFASDRVWLTPEFSVLAGGRWDYFDSKYHQATTSNSNPAPFEGREKTSAFSPKASLIWEPTQDQTYYASWARSFTPAGQFIANTSSAISPNTPNLDPEKSDLYEVGAKVNFLGGLMSVTGAVFQIEKSNAFFTDPVTGDTETTGEEQRVRGIELGVSGKPTDAWTVGLSYSYMDSEILAAFNSSGAPTGVEGNEVAYVPHNSVSLWTSYEVSRHLEMDGRLDVGGGIVYSDAYYTNSANTGQIPESFSLDAFVAYEYNNLKFALNGYNLTDSLNYSTGWSNRAVVAPGRSFVLTVSTKF
ncbi:TonB-dependent siderophore receptor [Pseudaminobacter arsenicus]|uniref:TonB-dependent siderophore receptor n=2 Tax=Borborobacter arsenicus TaxID=1851146 RepID=A0A432V844_9HYPH|nr:TonB-dependent siderophore receptor [Pseudaminobacter arsenicus]